MAYGDAMGYLPFREAIAEHLGALRGVRCEAAQILVTTGSQQALHISAQVWLESVSRARNAKWHIVSHQSGYCDRPLLGSG